MTKVLDRLPPRRAVFSAEEAEAQREERERKEAHIRGVDSIPAMREAIKQASRRAPVITEVPRLRKPDAAAFRRQAAIGLPFLIDGIVQRWPLAALPPSILREQYGHMPVRARVGDYINTAFAADRAMQDMAMAEYLDLVDTWSAPLPPYLGNLELRELNSLCHWPGYFGKMGPARFWVGPEGTCTPLHCDYDDNIFAQVWGTKRIWLAPAHHDEYLYTWQANSLLYGSHFNPEAPDYDKYPLARQAALIECVVQPGDMLYVPAGWYHQVNALTFSLSSNRWARSVPFALAGK
ncbi:cupin-like domain-containing protein [Oxalobacteraceae bacterium A2-2]